MTTQEQASALSSADQLIAASGHNFEPDRIFGGHSVCSNCGAFIEEFQDNRSPVCVPVEGPHRLTIMNIRRDIRSAERTVEGGQAAIRNLKGQIDNVAATIGTMQHYRAMLAATLAELEQINVTPPLRSRVN